MLFLTSTAFYSRELSIRWIYNENPRIFTVEHVTSARPRAPPFSKNHLSLENLPSACTPSSYSFFRVIRLDYRGNLSPLWKLTSVDNRFVFSSFPFIEKKKEKEAREREKKSHKNSNFSQPEIEIPWNLKNSRWIRDENEKSFDKFEAWLPSIRGYVNNILPFYYFTPFTTNSKFFANESEIGFSFFLTTLKIPALPSFATPPPLTIRKWIQDPCEIGPSAELFTVVVGCSDISVSRVRRTFSPVPSSNGTRNRK